jgi:hypothetical protein
VTEAGWQLNNSLCQATWQVRLQQCVAMSMHALRDVSGTCEVKLLQVVVHMYPARVVKLGRL